MTGNEPINKPLLPMISNQRMNSYLKEIAEILGINKRLTTGKFTHICSLPSTLK